MPSLALFFICATLAAAAPAADPAPPAAPPKEFNDFSDVRPLLLNDPNLRFLDVNGTYVLWDEDSKIVLSSASAAYNAAIHDAVDNGGCLQDAANIMRAAQQPSESGAPGSSGDERPVGDVPFWREPYETCNYHRCQIPGQIYPCANWHGCGVCSGKYKCI